MNTSKFFWSKGYGEKYTKRRNYFVLSFYTHLQGVADGTGRTISNRAQRTFLYSLLRFSCGSVGFMESVILPAFGSVEQLMDHGIWSIMAVMNSYSKNTL